MTMHRFEGKVALITGAASGLGRAVAQRLAQEGAAIVGVDIESAGLEATAKGVLEAGGRMETVSCDVRLQADCKAAVGRALEAFGQLDILCNCAGVVRFHDYTQMPEEDWNLIIGVNLTGTAFMCQAALPALLDAHGNIVNVASVAALQGQAYTVAYTASKAGVVQLTRSLALEYVNHPIRINAVAPGGIDTPMNENHAFPKNADWKLIHRYTSPRGMAQAEEIADTIVYLASPEARVIHGVVLPIDHGMTAD